MVVRSAPEVHLRPYRLDDAPALWEAAQESMAELRPWLPWCHPAYSIHESRSWLQVQVAAFEQGAEFEFAMLAPDGRFLGGCGLNQIERANHRANLGYWVRTSATNQGVATRSVHLLRDWAFEKTDLVRLELVIAVENQKSLRVAEKAGASREGVLRKRLFLSGVVHDATMFSLTKGAPAV